MQASDRRATLSRARRRLNLLLLVLAVALAASMAISLKIDRPRTVSGLGPADIGQITVARLGAAPYTLKRLSGRWQLSAPGVAAVAERARSDLVAAGVARSRGAHPLSELDAAAVGLAEPRVALELNGKIRLEFGDRAALSGLRYVRVGDRIHLVDDRHYHSVNQALEEVLARHLLPEGSEMVGLTLGPWRLRWIDGVWVSAGVPEVRGPERLASSWATAEATVVGQLNPRARTGEPVSIALADPERTLTFELMRSSQAEGLFLARRDLGVAYHFPPDRAPAVPQPISR